MENYGKYRKVKVVIIPVDQNLKVGRVDDVCLAGNLWREGNIPARQSDDLVRKSAKRYKKVIRILWMNS